jgi:hypothetical protein
MNKLSNSAMLLDIEDFLKQQIADMIKTCPSRIRILSIGCIDQQWSQPVDENGFAIDEDDDEEAAGYEQRAIRNVEWRLSYFNGDGMANGKVYTAELESHWSENIHDSKDYVHLCLDKDDAQSLIEELTELSEVNLRDAQKYLL